MYKDIFYGISEYLYPVDMMSLRCTCKELMDVGKFDIRKLMIKGLEEFTDKPETLLRLIDEANFVISGSFMLKCLSGGDWKCGDLDIYEEVPDYEDYEYTYSGKRGVFYRAFYSEIGFEVSNTVTYSKLSYSQRTYSKKGKGDINIIPVAGVDVLKMIRHSYDSDIFKNAYKNGNLYVTNWFKLMYKKDYIMPTTIFTIVIYEHVLLNGETFSVKPRIQETILGKKEFRRKKYLQRGYQLYDYPDENYFTTMTTKLLQQFDKSVLTTRCNIFEYFAKNNINILHFSTLPLLATYPPFNS